LLYDALQVQQNTNAKVSGSQPGCRDTQGSRKDVLEVPPILKFQWTTALYYVTTWGAPKIQNNPVGVP